MKPHLSNLNGRKEENKNAWHTEGTNVEPTNTYKYSKSELNADSLRNRFTEDRLRK